MHSGRLASVCIWRCLLTRPSTLRSRHATVRPPKAGSQLGLCQTRFHGAVSSELRAEEPVEGGHSWEERLLGQTSPAEAALSQSTVEELTMALMAMRNLREWSPAAGHDFDRHGRIIQMVQHMIRARCQTPNIFMYECLMDAMADPEGSAIGVRKLLLDMKAQKVKPSAAVFHSALAALANHPDYMLRQDVLTLMSEHWVLVDTAAQQNVVVGLLREEQYELAYARLTRMMEQGVHVDCWVYDLFIMAFGKLGFLDEMMVLLHQRGLVEGASDQVLNTLLYFVLDVCSESFHLDGTVFAWKAVVSTSKVQPPDGIVDNVMATAARHGKPALAIEALDLLSKRSWVQARHYETVVEAFAAAGDIAGALRILCIMRKHGRQKSTVIKRDHTRPIKQAMLRDPKKLVAEAERAVRSLAKDEAVSPALVGVVVEAQAEVFGSEAALSLYKDMASLSASPPDALTMQTLIVHCKSHETRRSIARDYASAVSPDADPPRNAVVYCELISACAAAGEMDLAFRFAAKAVPLCRSRRQISWFKPLMVAAVATHDDRIWAVVDEMLLRGGHVGATVQIIMQQSRMAKQFSDRQRGVR
ncbi:hypothetical protein L249_4282 [Ophiocordyceps polyrhachis-furcata BCC 54312]|uniref:Pentatricopeptide repeat-containing protein-mitochondrial domain-containing protein n=1 Tax=Ophiocordyceps polyrhachis-furcata BCC 54312 TaxID=1330021 RepID=A0A367L7Z0_9HYPO|nr:hypothetical protein L249_4282 [Ophiocordyceps polyrhachis-furcata BCC 54312]